MVPLGPCTYDYTLLPVRALQQAPIALQPHQAPCILQLLQPHVLLPYCHHCWVKLPAMQLALRVGVVDQVCNGASTLQTETQDKCICQW